MNSETKCCKTCKHHDKLAEEEPCKDCSEIHDLLWEAMEETEE